MQLGQIFDICIIRKVCGVSRKFCKHAEDSINDTVWKGPKTTWPNCRVGENRSRVGEI